MYLSVPPNYETITENRGEGGRKVRTRSVHSDGRLICDRPTATTNSDSFQSSAQTDTLRSDHISEPAG